MKLMFASDLHGSLYYAKKMINAFQKEGAERLVLLGDILYHGPRNPLPRDYDPKGVFGLLNERKRSVSCVRGNCDAEVDQWVLEFPILSESMLFFLAGRTAFVTHGHIWNSGNPPLIGPKDILVHGHTHIAAVADMGKHIYVNPGSAAMPKEGPPSYMIYEDGLFTIVDFEGNELNRYKII